MAQEDSSNNKSDNSVPEIPKPSPAPPVKQTHSIIHNTDIPIKPPKSQ
jgi:hypothetical protein